MATTFRPCEPDRMLLLAPDVRDWLPEGHFAHHVGDLVDGLDLTAFYAPYEGDGRRNAPYEPRMMVKVLLYGYAAGVFSSRALARKLEEDVAFRVLGAGHFPSHRTLCEFRRPEWKRNPKGGQPCKRACGEPEDKAQSNFTDPDSAIMKTSAEGFQQCCNAQVAVDGEHQLIVATELTSNASGQGAMVGLLDEVEDRFDEQPETVLADAGYCNERDLPELETRGIDGYVAPRADSRHVDHPPGRNAPRGRPGCRFDCEFLRSRVDERWRIGLRFVGSHARTPVGGGVSRRTPLGFVRAGGHFT